MPASYRVSIETPESRIETIKAQTVNPLSTYPFPHFKTRMHPLPVITIPIEVPLYRMVNYRTRVEQLIRIREKGLVQDFFSNGQENQSAQQIQHDVLYDFAQRGIGDSIIPIVNVLKESLQEEPILITHTGVVVNGNRRLAAMRELFVSSGGKQYSQVDCMVLPEYATEKEIRDIEWKLQMTPQTLLPYDWACEGIAIKESLEFGETKEMIASTMRKKPVDIDNHLLAFEHAELYVTDRLGTPGDFTNADKQMFFDIAKNLKGKLGEDLEASRNIAYVLTDNSGDLGTRVYDYKNSFGPDSKEVIQRLARRLNITLTNAQKHDDHLDLDFNLDEEKMEDEISLSPVIEVLKDKERSKELSNEIKEICDNLKSERDDRDAGQHALKRIREANTKLLEVDLTRADSNTYQAIREQLDSIQYQTVKLRTQLDRQSSIGEGGNV